MATGTSKSIVKEFNYPPAGIIVRLVHGFDGDEPAYWAMEVHSGLNKPILDPGYKKIKAEVFAPNMEGHENANRIFKDEVKRLL